MTWSQQIINSCLAALMSLITIIIAYNANRSDVTCTKLRDSRFAHYLVTFLYNSMKFSLEMFVRGFSQARR